MGAQQISSRGWIKKGCLCFTPKMSLISSALWENKKTNDTINHKSQLPQHLYYHQHPCWAWKHPMRWDSPMGNLFPCWKIPWPLLSPASREHYKSLGEHRRQKREAPNRSLQPHASVVSQWMTWFEYSGNGAHMICIRSAVPCRDHHLRAIVF